MARLIGFLKAHKRAILFFFIFAYALFLLLHPDEFGRFVDLVFLAILVMLIASQVFWIRRVLDLAARLVPGRPRRAWFAIITVLVYLFVFTYSYPSIQSTNNHIFRAADYRLHGIVIEAAFWWWFVGSLLGFLMVMALGILDRTACSAAWLLRKARETVQGHGPPPRLGTVAPDPPLPGRRRFLERAALLVSATPFVAAGYGLLYERRDVEVVRQPIRLARLPEAFEGFHIAQLSDLHIGPFSPANYIRHCVAITNQLKPDLIALTGDYIAWDTEAQGEVVQVLAGLRAPHGVFGCLGNHEEEGQIEESITHLFGLQGIRILRQERAPIRLGGEMLNLIGIDCPRGGSDEEWRTNLNRRLQQIKRLMMPDTVNILLSHYTDVFDSVAEIGIDLTLAGDLHGGAQMSLEFVHRGLNLASLYGARYVSGRYEKHGSQLYANRGIGTTGFPIRIGARPEITLFELTRLKTA
jgi:predicted MPP superfamily phosphohydrolase